MIILLLILINYIFCQDIEPVPMPLIYKGQLINIEQERFQQQNFFMGWQWSGHKKMIKAMGTNIKSGGAFFPESWESYETSNKVLAQTGKKAIAWNYPFIQAAAWLQSLLLSNNRVNKRKFITKLFNSIPIFFLFYHIWKYIIR